MYSKRKYSRKSKTRITTRLRGKRTLTHTIHARALFSDDTKTTEQLKIYDSLFATMCSKSPSLFNINIDSHYILLGGGETESLATSIQNVIESKHVSMKRGLAPGNTTEYREVKPLVDYVGISIKVLSRFGVGLSSSEDSIPLAIYQPNNNVSLKLIPFTGGKLYFAIPKVANTPHGFNSNSAGPTIFSNGWPLHLLLTNVNNVKIKVYYKIAQIGYNVADANAAVKSSKLGLVT